jgi:GNAT superfamily N-acetyltransferase
MSQPLVEPSVAAATDVDDIVALAQSAYRGEGSKQGWTTEAELLDGQRTNAADVLALITGAYVLKPVEANLPSAEPNSVILILRDDTGRLITSCNVALSNPHGHALDGPRSAYFGLFSVAPDLQNAGIGKRMMTAAEDYACVVRRDCLVSDSHAP